jgi:hypothetical protein
VPKIAGPQLRPTFLSHNILEMAEKFSWPANKEEKVHVSGKTPSSKFDLTWQKI